MFLGIKATTMVLDDIRRDLGETRLHVLIIPERVQVREEEWRRLQARSHSFSRTATSYWKT